MENEYITGFNECLSKISGVCDGCGGKLEPVQMIYNTGSKTHWIGCRHGNKFCSGVTKEVFDIARELVVKENFVAYKHLEDPRGKKDINPGEVEYYLDSQTAGMTGIVMNVLRVQKKLAGIL